MSRFGVSRVEGIAAVINGLATPVAVLLAFGFEYAAFDFASGWRNPPDWFVIALNVVPSALAGALVFAAAARLLRSWRPDAETARFLPRNAVPLVLAGGLAALIVIDWRYEDFWMVAQLLIYPLTALVAGLGTEAARRKLTARYIGE